MDRLRNTNRGATVGDRGSMAWMPAFIAVPNLLSMISMGGPIVWSKNSEKCKILFNICLKIISVPVQNFFINSKKYPHFKNLILGVEPLKIM
jgi:hypothetical protein